MNAKSLITACLLGSLAVSSARTWNGPDEEASFKGELKEFDKETGKVVILVNGRYIRFDQEKLSKEDQEYLAKWEPKKGDEEEEKSESGVKEENSDDKNTAPEAEPKNSETEAEEKPKSPKAAETQDQPEKKAEAKPEKKPAAEPPALVEPNEKAKKAEESEKKEPEPSQTKEESQTEEPASKEKEEPAAKEEQSEEAPTPEKKPLAEHLSRNILSQLDGETFKKVALTKSPDYYLLYLAAST